MKHILTVTAIAATLTGIWQHDWRTITAGLIVAAVWPLIRDDVYGAAEGERDEQLWGD